MKTALRYLTLVKMASTLSEEELAALMPTKQEAGENGVARGFGHLLHGPVTTRRYGAARTVADATGQRTPFLNKHPRTGALLSQLAGGGIGAAGGALAGGGMEMAKGYDLGSDKVLGSSLVGAAGGGILGMLAGQIAAARSRAKGVEDIREGARHKPVDRNIDPNVSLPGWLQLSTGDYDRGVSDAHRVFQGGRNQRVRPGDNLVRTLRALTSTMNGTGIGTAAGVAEGIGSLGRKWRSRETLDRTQDKRAE